MNAEELSLNFVDLYEHQKLSAALSGPFQNCFGSQSFGFAQSQQSQVPQKLFSKAIDLTLESEPQQLLSTGLEAIDQRLNGGIRAKEICLIQSQGPKAISHQLCANALRLYAQRKVAYVDCIGLFDLAYLEEKLGVQREQLRDVIYGRCYNDAGLFQLFEKLLRLIESPQEQFSLVVVDLMKSFDYGFQEDLQLSGATGGRSAQDLLYTKQMSRYLHQLEKAAFQKHISVAIFAPREPALLAKDEPNKENLLLQTPARKNWDQNRQNNLQSTAPHAHSLVQAFRNLPLQTRTPRNSLERTASSAHQHQTPQTALK